MNKMSLCNMIAGFHYHVETKEFYRFSANLFLTYNEQELKEIAISLCDRFNYVSRETKDPV